MSGIAFYPPAQNTARIPSDTGCTEMKNAMPAGRRIRESENVRIFQAVFKRVFSWRKICLRYFKIGQTYFEICALYFFFAPRGGSEGFLRFNISALAGLLQHVKKCHCGRVGYSRTQTNFAGRKNARSAARIFLFRHPVLRRALPCRGTKKHPRRSGRHG